jgi:uncharacterized protein (DUF2236 family)
MPADGAPPIVAQRLNSERVVLLGWSRAILMQLAHPLVAAGVLAHSTFRGGAYEAAVRLHHTVSAMLSLTFGDDAARRAALSRILGIHKTVNGTLAEAVGMFPAGTRYSAEDPALVLWVHATLLDSIADVYQRTVEPLSRAELDAFCEESAPTLIDLGGDPETAPRTWDALTAYMRRMDGSGIFAVTGPSRALANNILSPRAAGLRVPFAGINRLVTIGLLPPLMRTLYGFEWHAARERRFQRTLRIIRATRGLAPNVIARWPQAR